MLKSPSQNYALIQYMIRANIPLINNEKLSKLFSCQPGVLLKKYNIDLKQLLNEYSYEEYKKENEGKTK